jgi:hypothetical protein
MEYHSDIKKKNYATWRKVDGARVHHVKQNNADSEGQTLHVFSHMQNLYFKKYMKEGVLFEGRMWTRGRREGGKRW